MNWIRRFVRFHGRRHPKDMGETEVRDFLSSLAVERGVSASTQNQALAALRFLYDAVLARPLSRADDFTPAPRREREPTVLSEHEVRVLLARLSRVPRLCAELMYGSGLRVSECLALRVKDVDLDRLEIVVRGGKGDRDRRTRWRPGASRCCASTWRASLLDTSAIGGVTSARRTLVSRCRGSTRMRSGSGDGGMCLRRCGRWWTTQAFGGVITLTRVCCSVRFRRRRGRPSCRSG